MISVAQCSNHGNMQQTRLSFTFSSRSSFSHFLAFRSKPLAANFKLNKCSCFRSMIINTVQQMHDNNTRSAGTFAILGGQQSSQMHDKTEQQKCHVV